MTHVTIGERIGELAAMHPDSPAVVAVAPDGSRSELTWRELEELSNRAARGLTGDTVGVALPAGIDHVITTLAAWKTGALVVPLDAHATAAERSAYAEALGDHVLVGNGDWATLRPGWWADEPSAEPLEPAVLPRSASLTGGTTGRPRVVLRQRPWKYPRGEILSSGDVARGMRHGGVQLVVLPMHHAGFTALHQGLALDHLVVVMERFIPSLFPELVREYRVDHVRIVPALMRMILDVPGLSADDLASIRSLHHGAGPCPDGVKRRWLELIGPERVYEDYASQERIGWTIIRGDEWLEHPGSVGKPPEGSEVRIYVDDRQAAPGEIGEVYLRSPASQQPAYVGPGPELAERDGFLSVGDLGYLDEDGYLYLVDRKSNVINVGGVNVYPAEIEAVLLQLAGVADAVVVSRPHEYLGQAVHALVVPAGPISTRDLAAHCREQLSATKQPLSFELVDSVPRQSTGKLLRRPSSTSNGST